jgi:hypothetical protein
MDPYMKQLVELSIVKEQTPKLIEAIDLLYIRYCIKSIQLLWRKYKYVTERKNKIKKYQAKEYHMKNCEICGYKIIHIPGLQHAYMKEYLNCGCEFYGNRLHFSKQELEAHLQYNIGYGNSIK